MGREREIAMENLLIENQVRNLMKYLTGPEGLKNQTDGITQIKKSKALGNFGFAILLITLGVLASIYGIADVFGGKNLPMGTLFLIGGPIMLLGGIYMVFYSSSRAVTASKEIFENDLENLCRTFYINVFCKKTTDFGTKENQIVDFCQFIPVPILENYTKSGWNIFIGKPKPRSGGQPITCARCEKKLTTAKSISLLFLYPRI